MSSITLKTALVDLIERPNQPRDYCHAALVSWAIDEDAEESLDEIMYTALIDGADCATAGKIGCWCGKYRGGRDE